VSLVYKIEHKNAAWRSVLSSAIRDLTAAAEAGDVMLRISDVLRSLDQNAKQWALLRDIAAVVPMTINGVAQLASTNEWKAVLSAAHTKEVRFAQDPTGPGLIALGVSTSNMPKKVFSEYIEFLYWFGSEHNVTWSEKATEHHSLYGNKDRRTTT